MLTDAQIQYIHAFCTKKGVKYYDLRSEIVDHLAESIEQKFKENPTINFETALKSVYAQFGIFGFGKIVSEREAASLKQLKKLNHQYFNEYFTFSKIGLTLSIFLILSIPYILFKSSFDFLYVQCILVYVICSVLFFILSYKNYKQPPQKLLSLNWMDNVGWMILGLQLPNQILKLISNEATLSLNPSPLWLSILLTGFTTLGILYLIAKLHVRKMMYHKAKTDYPLAFMPADI